MIKTLFVRIFFFLYCMTVAIPAFPCTGITFNAKDGSHVVARTIEWGGSFLNSCYVVVPRGYTQQSYLRAEVRTVWFSLLDTGMWGLPWNRKSLLPKV